VEYNVVNFNVTRKIYAYCKDNFDRYRGAFGTLYYPHVAEIEGLDSIHQVISRKNLMLLTNQIKEIFIVI